ncbi:MAG TPA: hypothetical protein VFC53_10195 [Dehalococcoidia bacterium]|jgi:FtsH-binding integral membrane protein|nr:hypothetical protein [Dehalococcoidia bacterium]
MNRAGHYETTSRGGTSMMKDVETWLANGLATILAGLGIASGVIGLLVAFDYIGGSNNLTDFQSAMTWMVGGLILAICANVFRREHHVVDPGERMSRVDYDRDVVRER